MPRIVIPHVKLSIMDTPPQKRKRNDGAEHDFEAVVTASHVDDGLLPEVPAAEPPTKKAKNVSKCIDFPFPVVDTPKKHNGRMPDYLISCCMGAIRKYATARYWNGRFMSKQRAPLHAMISRPVEELLKISNTDGVMDTMKIWVIITATVVELKKTFDLIDELVASDKQVGFKIVFRTRDDIFSTYEVLQTLVMFWIDEE